MHGGGFHRGCRWSWTCCWTIRRGGHLRRGPIPAWPRAWHPRAAGPWFELLRIATCYCLIGRSVLSSFGFELPDLMAARQLNKSLTRGAAQGSWRARDTDGAYTLPTFQTVMPSFLALSARLSWIPVPGKCMTPIGSSASMASLRLNGAALAWLVQSGLNAI